MHEFRAQSFVHHTQCVSYTHTVGHIASIMNAPMNVEFTMLIHILRVVANSNFLYVCSSAHCKRARMCLMMHHLSTTVSLRVRCSSTHCGINDIVTPLLKFQVLHESMMFITLCMLSLVSFLKPRQSWCTCCDLLFIRSP